LLLTLGLSEGFEDGFSVGLADTDGLLLTLGLGLMEGDRDGLDDTLGLSEGFEDGFSEGLADIDG
jgi:hypothetical protein